MRSASGGNVKLIVLSTYVKDVRRDQRDIGRRNAVDQTEFDRGAASAIDVRAGLSNAALDIAVVGALPGAKVSDAGQLQRRGRIAVVYNLRMEWVMISISSHKDLSASTSAHFDRMTAGHGRGGRSNSNECCELCELHLDVLEGCVVDGKKDGRWML